MTEKTGSLNEERWFAEKTLDYLLHKSQVVLLLLAPSGEIIYANTYARALLNRDTDGVHISEFLITGSWNDSLLYLGAGVAR